MSVGASSNYANIIPSIRYRDAAKAVQWLGAAFGFRTQLVVPGENNTIEHAQLVLGNGMIMLGSSRDDDFGRLQSPLESIDAAVSQSLYIIVDDVDGHFAEACLQGAIIEQDPEDQPYGGRLYSCRDFEGNLWSFGDYNPWLE